MKFVIVGEAGGSHTRVCVFDNNTGEVLSLFEKPGSNPYLVGNHQCETVWKEVCGELRANMKTLAGGGGDLTSSIVNVIVGAIGDSGVITSHFLKTLNTRPVMVTDITTSSYALGSGWSGVVLIAGTGSVAAKIKNGNVEKIKGGFGWLLGDEGSGFWIGRKILQKTLILLENNDESERDFLNCVESHIQEKLTPNSVTGYCYSHIKNNPSYISKLSVILSEVATPLTKSIAEKAGKHLTNLAESLITHPEERIILTGGVANSGVREYILPNHQGGKYHAANGLKGGFNLSKQLEKNKAT